MNDRGRFLLVKQLFPSPHHGMMPTRDGHDAKPERHDATFKKCMFSPQFSNRFVQEILEIIGRENATREREAAAPALIIQLLSPNPPHITWSWAGITITAHPIISFCSQAVHSAAAWGSPPVPQCTCPCTQLTTKATALARTRPVALQAGGYIYRGFRPRARVRQSRAL